MSVISVSKEFFGVISVILAGVSVAPYIYFIIRGKVKPHAFSWFIWSILTGIGCAAQVAEGAGPGAWITGFLSAACLLITLLAVFKIEQNITRSDWLSFIAAIMAIPLWMATNDPLWSVILISTIDMIGYYPTFRKSYTKPQEELVFTFVIGGIKYVFSVLAIADLSLTTWLYPVSVAVSNLSLAALLVIRRKILASKTV